MEASERTAEAKETGEVLSFFDACWSTAVLLGYFIGIPMVLASIVHGGRSDEDERGW